MLFKDRRDAGSRLAGVLRSRRLTDPVILALPRGGVPVGFEVAGAFEAPLDVLVARKIGAPGRPELGIGALAEGGEPLYDPGILEALHLRPEDVADQVAEERAELERRVRRYRGDRPALDVTGRDTVVVDDGLATGVTARAALRAVRPRQPRRLVLAVPVCAEQTVSRMADEADDLVWVHSSASFGAVGQWYEEFAQVPDDAVVELLASARGEAPAGGPWEGSASGSGARARG